MTKYLTKWRKDNPEKRNAARKRNYMRGRTHARNHQQRWTIKDEEIILKSDLSDRELAVKLGRSVQAIQMHRTRIKNGRAQRADN